MAKRKFKPGINVDHEYHVVGGTESVVTIADHPFGKFQEIIQIHPWDRGRNNRWVYIEVGFVTKKGHPIRVKKGEQGLEDWTQATIVKRDDFVEAVLAVFPELQRNPNVC